LAKRKNISLSEKLASALLDRVNPDGTPVIDREVAKTMTIKQILATVEYDHGVHVAIGGDNHPTNLTPRTVADHRAKTAKIDIPQIAKTKRIEREQAEFRRKLLVKSGMVDDAPDFVVPKPKSKIQGLGFGKATSKFQSRGFDKTKSKKFSGKVVAR
jgi:hypothetical protein